MRIKSNISKVGIYAFTSAFTLFAQGAIAQDDTGTTLEEVVVTAQKRTENLQEVPIALTALTEDMLEVNGVTDTDSFANLVPNLHIKQGTTGSTTLAIRGVSNNNASNPGYENAVGMYIDGVYVGKAFGSLFDLGDVAQIEVLRGPQGTLYGRNTIGGAINLVSTRPSGEAGGSFTVGGGNDSLFYVRGGIDTGTWGTENEGLGTLKARFAFFDRSKDGMTKNIFQDPTDTALPIVEGMPRFGDVDRDGYRIVIDWDISDSLGVTYDYNASNADDTMRLFQVFDVPAGSSRPEKYIDYAPNGQPDVGSANERTFFKTEIKSHVLTVSWDINDNLTLKSITARREISADDGQDLDGTNIGFFESIRDYDSEDISQELQLIGHTDALKYVVGYYYSEEEIASLRTQQFSSGTFHRVKNAYLDNDNEAVFGQVDWSVSDQLTVSLGARYTEETKDAGRYIANFLSSSGTYDFLNPGPAVVLDTLDFDDTSVMASVAYQFSPDINAYIKYAEGFRSGGYDGSVVPYTAAAVPFDSETLKTYEVGLKTRMLDNSWQLNISAFYSDYDDIQLTSFDGLVATTLNAGEMSISGLEVESTYLVSENLQIKIDLSYLDYDFDKFDLGPIIGDVSHLAELNNAPEYTTNVAIDYAFPNDVLGGKLDLHMNYNYSDTAHAVSITSAGGAPNSEMDSRGLVDARLTLSELDVADQALRISIWGKNLADKEYIDNIIDFGSFRSGTLGPDRSYGIEVTVDL